MSASSSAGRLSLLLPYTAEMSRDHFGTLADGTAVSIWTLANDAGMRVRIMDFGAAVLSIEAPDRDGRLADVALGYDTLDDYVNFRGCLGAIVGRFANRIAHGRFVLDGRTIQVPPRGGVHHLHGGPNGFDRQVWSGQWIEPGRSVRFSRRSPDGEEGYPGTCEVSVSYTLTDANELAVDYAATTDAPTPVNLSQHTYFNLAGHDAGGMLDHEIQIVASQYTAVDETLIPTGSLPPVAGSAFDFRTPHTIGSRIEDADPQLLIAGGYDHNFVLDREGGGLQVAVRVRDPRSGRTLEVRTTEPGVQFYTGNMLDGSQMGKGGHPYRTSRRFLSRDAALSRLTESSVVSDDHPAPGAAIPIADGARLWRGLGVRRSPMLRRHWPGLCSPGASLR